MQLYIFCIVKSGSGRIVQKKRSPIQLDESNRNGSQMLLSLNSTHPQTYFECLTVMMLQRECRPKGAALGIVLVL